MRVQIVAPFGRCDIDTGRAAAGGAAVPCHRCGLCCERWQPLLTSVDAGRLAVHLGLSLVEFHDAYTSPYPFDDEQRLLRQEDGRCIFLCYDTDGRAACTVHSARPQVCRDWAAGLDKNECVQGLARFAAPDGLIQIDDLYPDRDERAAFTGAAYPDRARRS